jgi:hypothetical protein
MTSPSDFRAEVEALRLEVVALLRNVDVLLERMDRLTHAAYGIPARVQSAKGKPGTNGDSAKMIRGFPDPPAR